MEKKNISNLLKFSFLILLEVALLFFIFSNFSQEALGGIGENVTVITWLQIGNVFPEILNVSIQNGAATFTLTPNASKVLVCNAVIRDYNGENDTKLVYAEFYHSASNWLSTDDNNNHYTNASCNVSNTFGTFNGYTDDEYTSLANCTFGIWYYSDPGTWTCTVLVNDTSDYQDMGNDTITVSELISIGLPNIINYSTVNATAISSEVIANVTNFGNVKVNLSLSGYANVTNDNLAMNCTLGSLRNISVVHEKYNLTASNPGDITSYTEFGSKYVNLSSTITVKKFDLSYRQNDTYNDAVNASYWRIYVPRGVAGTCTGNIVFGATKQVGT